MKEYSMSPTLTPCPPVGPHCIQRNDDNRVLIVDNSLVKFTPTEYQFLMHLLEGGPVSDVDLVRAIFRCNLDRYVRESLNKYMDKIRSKLRPLGLNIHRVAKYGYILLATQG